MNGADHIIIKVTDGAHRAYFCHFQREPPYDLIELFEYKPVLALKLGMTTRMKQVVLAARSKIPETVGEDQ